MTGRQRAPGDWTDGIGIRAIDGGDERIGSDAGDAGHYDGVARDAGHYDGVARDAGHYDGVARDAGHYDGVARDAGHYDGVAGDERVGDSDRLTVPAGRIGVRPPGVAVPRPRPEYAAPPADLRPWPLVGLLLLYPLWWALGLGVIIFPLVAVPMAYMLLRHRLLTRTPTRLPPGFGWWVLFLIAVVVSIGMLGTNPPGTVPATFGSRLVAVLFRAVEYGSLTVLMIFAGNLTEAQVSRRRLVGLLSWLFAITVAGGFLGMVAGKFQFNSPIELLLPAHWRDNTFVQSLVHPAAAQLMNVLGHPSPRPAAPWGYTNTWGNNFCLLVVWFAVAGFGLRATTRRGKVLAAALLVASIAPVVYSLNRGLWIGLGVSAGYLVLRFVSAGRLWVVGVLGALVVVLGVTLMVTPLGTVVTQRLDNGKSNGVRLYLTDNALDGLSQSPVIGFGSTRNTEGGRNSITVGSSSDCPHCGNFTIGGNGQLWQVLYAHGLAGTIAYFGFFGYGLWRFRRDRTPIGLAASTAIVGSFAASFWYNSLVTPLAFTLLAYALLWRNEIQRHEAQRTETQRTETQRHETQRHGNDPVTAAPAVAARTVAGGAR